MQDQALNDPTKQSTATTAAVINAVLVVVLGAGWLVRGDLWLPVAAVSLPPAVLAAALSAWAVRSWSPALADERLSALLRVSMVAAGGAVSVAAARALLLTTDQRESGNGLVVGAAREALLVLPVSLLAAVLAALLLQTRRPTRRGARARVRTAGIAVASLAVVVGTAGLVSPISSPAGAAATGPCPSGSPTKTFNVQAINVNMPLNRFGDHDPLGRMYVLSSQVSAVRSEETSQKVSVGLRDDAIQPLVIRANEGDCVTITYKNAADGGAFGLHIDGLPFGAGSEQAVGANAATNPAKGGSRTYRYYVPIDPTLEGAHYLHPGVGFRAFVNHGLFGALVVEPPGSTYGDPNGVNEAAGGSLASGWEAIIRPAGKKEFRENVQLYHEIGNESELQAIVRKNGTRLPLVDPHTDTYRPGTRAMNYRTEPFINRLDLAPTQEAHAYGSYTFGDPATPIPRGYLGDPTKFRILHAGSEIFHVFHMHGGGIRWRFNPVADPTWNNQVTGLDKHPVEQAQSERLDSQSFGPGESYNLEIEGGAGGVQQGAGDFLFHCHIAEHYVSGMWSFWRVYDTRQPEFAPLADRTAPPVPVSAEALIGTDVGTASGKTHITADNLDDWIRPQLPPQGLTSDNADAAVWNWTTAPSGQYLGEPESTTAYADYYNDPGRPGHPTALPVDQFVGNRPVILFNPLNGRPAFPLLRPHLGKRPPFAAGGHSGAPYLGENGDKQAPASGVDPTSNRNDGICPARQASGDPTRLRRFNVVAIEKAVKTNAQDTDPNGMVYTLAHDKQAVLNGDKPVQPLAIRADLGDCVAVTLTSELTDARASDGHSMVDMHIHHVQFDTQASDGVITGLSYEQAVRPYKAEDPMLTDPAAAGDTVLHLASVAKFHVRAAIGVGLGTEGPDTEPGTTVNPASGQGPEIRSIVAIDPTAKTVTLDRPLVGDHPAGQWAGVEFTQYRWFPDVDLDNIFWHDHVDGIHTWAHGLIGQLVTEPKDATFHDPRTGAEVDSGPIVDIHTNRALSAVAGVTSSFRELALWTLDKGDGKVDDSYLSLRSAPLKYRGRTPGTVADPSLSFSSYKYGDPDTPLPRAYPGDPFVIRSVNVGPSVDTLHVDGHDFLVENRLGSPGNPTASSTDTLHYGISERFTLILRGGAGGTNQTPGDYLYFNAINRRLVDGAWGIIRVLPGRVPGATPDDPNFLLPLPGRDIGDGTAVPATGLVNGRPPAATGPDPCPASAPVRTFTISAVRTPDQNKAIRLAYVPAGTNPATVTSPLTMHLDAGDCVVANVTNLTKQGRIGFHLSGLAGQTASSGVNVGYDGETTIADGATRTYRYYADNPRLSGGAIGDLTGDGTAKRGLYGSYDIAPKGSTFTDPVTSQETEYGEAVDVAVPGEPDYRDFTVLASDDEPALGGSFMPYHASLDAAPSGVLNLRRTPVNDNAAAAFKVTPATPLFRAYPSDRVMVHVVVAPGSEQMHAFNFGGLSFPTDQRVPGGNTVQAKGVGPWEMMTAEIAPNSASSGDYVYSDLRRVFSQTGMWGLLRYVPPPANCPLLGEGLPLCLPDAG